MGSPLQRRSFVLLASTVIVAIVGYAGYSQFQSGEPGEAGVAASEVLEIETSSFYVTVANRGNQALTDVRVAIEPAGRTTFSSRTLSRLEAGERRNLSLSDFRSTDGTPFNLRVHRPRAVSASARSGDGEDIETRVGWR